MTSPMLVYTSNRSLRRLLDSWVNPGPKHRQVEKGLFLNKLATGVVVFSTVEAEESMLRLLLRLKWRYRDEVYIYSLSVPMETEDLKNLLDEVIVEQSSPAAGSPPCS